MAVNTNKKLPMFGNRKTKYKNVENTSVPAHKISRTMWRTNKPCRQQDLELKENNQNTTKKIY